MRGRNLGQSDDFFTELWILLTFLKDMHKVHGVLQRYPHVSQATNTSTKWLILLLLIVDLRLSSLWLVDSASR